MVIDLRLVREHPDVVRASQRARGHDESLVDALLVADAARREVVTRADHLRDGLLLRPQVVGAGDHLAAGGIGGQEGVDQGLVVPPRALAGSDDVGVLAHESEVDHASDRTDGLPGLWERQAGSVLRTI